MRAGTFAEIARPHAMSIDVEEHFQVWALADQYQRKEWGSLPSRVAGNTIRLLDALEQRNQRATFFTLGWVAERQGDLVRRIVDGGHELASHGYGHQPIYEMNEWQFRDDVKKSKEILEYESGVPVAGYRAPSFSVGAKSPWAHQVLHQTGYLYSSSVHPVANDHYGVGLAPTEAIVIDGIAEIPISTLPVLGKRLPCAGGGYFRLLPPIWSTMALGALDRWCKEPIVFYLHPWEIDPAQPRPSGLSWRTRIRHYYGLGSCMGRFQQLLDRFEWRPIDELYGFRRARS